MRRWADRARACSPREAPIPPRSAPAAFAALLGALSCALPAAAQPLAAPAPAVAADEARAAYEQGLGFLAEGRFHEAAVALERSLRLRPLPVVTYNLALAYRGLGRYVTAVEAFERYLRAPDPAAPAERLAAIREELAELRAQLVRVTVRVTPSEAVTTVDGRVLGAIPPGEAITLDPTPHVFAWTAPDHRPERRELPGVAGSSVSLDVTLEALREGRLTVEPTPATAAVSVDGRPLGAGRHELALSPGEHWVEVRAAGFVPARRAVRVGATGMVRLSLSLEREPTPAWVLPTVIGASVVGLGTLVAVLVAVLRPTIPEPQRGSWDSVGGL